MTIECKFNIGDKVKIPILETTGRIKTIWYVERGLQYQVRYFIDGKVVEEYFYEDELTQ